MPLKFVQSQIFILRSTISKQRISMRNLDCEQVEPSTNTWTDSLIRGRLPVRKRELLPPKCITVVCRTLREWLTSCNRLVLGGFQVTYFKSLSPPITELEHICATNLIDGWPSLCHVAN